MDPDSTSSSSQQPTTERLAVLEAETRGLKNSLSLLSSFAGIVFGLLGIALAWNVSSERAGLWELQKQLKDDVRTALGQVADEPEIVLLTKELRPLDGSVVEATVEDPPVAEGQPSAPDARRFVAIPIVIRNDGRGWTSDVAFKIYTTGALQQAIGSLEEPGFPYEQHWLGQTTGLTSLPGRFSYPFSVNIFPVSDVQPGRHPCLVKVYYGLGKVTRANLTVWIK